MTRTSSPPSFVVVEGLDGVGKSTLAAALAQALGAELLATPPEELRQVRGAVDASFARSALARQLFYAATVADASDRVRALLRRGRPVVLDRYLLSTLVYAELVSGARALALDDLAARIAAPDATLLCVAPLAARKARLEARGAPLLAHDALTATPEGHEAGMAAYRRRRRHPAAGRMAELDLGRLAPAEAVRRALRIVRSARLPVAAPPHAAALAAGVSSAGTPPGDLVRRVV